MTRVNVVQPESLTNKHLLAEIHEITRVPSLVRKAQEKYPTARAWREKTKQPSEYTLGAGHVYFFYDKLEYIATRYASLCNEWRNRGYSVNELSREELLGNISRDWKQDYTPTQKAININKERIEQRTREAEERMKNK